MSFKQISPKCDEKKIKKEKIKKRSLPKNISLCLAKEKAKSICENYKNILVVGSDTIIETNNKIFQKAKNYKEARKRLTKLSGKKHQIHSSAAAYYNNKLIWHTTQSTTIKIRKLTQKDISLYFKYSRTSPQRR